MASLNSLGSHTRKEGLLEGDLKSVCRIVPSSDAERKRKGLIGCDPTRRTDA
jgi:hypothetical protein